MGAKFTNLLVRNDDLEAVTRAVVRARLGSAWVAHSGEGWVNVAPECAWHGLDELAESLSRSLSCPVVSLLCFDEDMFDCGVYDKGDRLALFCVPETGEYSEPGRRHGSAEVLRPWLKHEVAAEDLESLMNTGLMSEASTTNVLVQGILAEHEAEGTPVDEAEVRKSVLKWDPVSEFEGVALFKSGIAEHLATLLGASASAAVASYDYVSDDRERPNPERISSEYPGIEWQHVGGLRLV